MREVEDQRIYTVLVMLEFRTVGDKVEVEEMLIQDCCGLGHPACRLRDVDTRPG